jgi:hypothetical protein
MSCSSSKREHRHREKPSIEKRRVEACQRIARQAADASTVTPASSFSTISISMETSQSQISTKIVDQVISGPLAGITWDEFHCSPRAEVVLISQDMIGFRVDAWYLKKRR